MKIRPYTVGQESVIVVGLRGVVESIEKDSITIGGLTMPTRLDSARGIRYVSMVWPEGDETTCAREHCDSNGCEIDPEEDLRAEMEALVSAVEIAHYDRHEGAFRFCEDAICRQANDS